MSCRPIEILGGISYVLPIGERLSPLPSGLKSIKLLQGDSFHKLLNYLWCIW